MGSQQPLTGDSALSRSTPYPLIDNDPHFYRVVQYFRPKDYAHWAIGTAAAPALAYALQLSSPVDLGPRGFRPQGRLAATFGFVGGFLWAYQSSMFRFQGFIENDIEVKKDMTELTELAKQGKPLYGESRESDFAQITAHRNSQWSFLKFGALPWFNFTRHPFHGVDTKKYYQAAAEAEEK